MNRTRRDELDMLIETALKGSVSDEAPSDRVWKNIRLRVQNQSQETRPRLGYLRRLGMEVMAWGSGIFSTGRVILAPSVYSHELRSTERLIWAVHSSTPLHYSIHH